MALYGVDISDYQAGFDVEAYARAGHRFVILKVSEGATWRSKHMAAWRDRAHANGLALVGLYHFLRSNSTDAEISNFLAATGGLREREVAILDWEVDGPTAAQARAWLERIEAATDRRPWLYSYAPYLAARRTAELVRWSLCIAAYGPNDGREHPWPSTDRWAPFQDGPGSWPHEGRTLLWQFTSKGRVAGWGGALDVNRFDGTEADLGRLGGAAPAPPPQRKDAPEMFRFWHRGGLFLVVGPYRSDGGLDPAASSRLDRTGLYPIMAGEVDEDNEPLLELYIPLSTLRG